MREVHEHVLKLQAPSDRSLHVWFEPWAEGLAFPAGTLVELRASSPVEGKLEIEATDERTAIYAWPSSTLRALVGNSEVASFQQPVPDFLSREKVNLLFGSPPTPTAEEGGLLRSRPWWKFWR